MKSLLEEALGVALARERPLLSRAQRSYAALIVDRHSDDVGALEPLFKVIGKTSGIVAGLLTEISEEFPEREQVAWAECIRICLTHKNDATWLLIDPDIWIWPTRARRSAEKFLDDRRKDRFNNRFNSLIDAWSK